MQKQSGSPSAWKEKISDAEVVLVACDTQVRDPRSSKGLAKAIEKNLAKSEDHNG